MKPLAILLLLSIPAHAAELPCPKRYACWEVRLAVHLAGEQAVRAKAKQCGWSDRKIEEASKCLQR